MMVQDTAERRLEEANSTRQLFEQVYVELRKRASKLMAQERLDHTLSATALVNEAYLRLDSSRAMKWDTEAHFVCSVARAMQRILIDRARARSAQKRSAVRSEVGVESLEAVNSETDILLGEVDELIDSLERVDSQAADLVRLRLFAGLNVVDAGQSLGLTRWAAYELWSLAQAWFQSQATERA